MREEGLREWWVGVSFLYIIYLFFQDKYFTEVFFGGESFGSGVYLITVFATTNGQSDKVVAAETPISLYSIEKSLFINHLP